MKERICVDGSAWFKTVDWPVPGDGYVLVEGLSCSPVAVCLNCKGKIKTAQKERQVTPWAEVKIIG